MRYLTKIKIGDKYYNSTTSHQQLLEAKGGFLQTTINDRVLVTDGQGVFEKTEWKDNPKEIYINVSLTETIEIL